MADKTRTSIEIAHDVRRWTTYEIDLTDTERAELDEASEEDSLKLIESWVDAGRGVTVDEFDQSGASPFDPDARPNVIEIAEVDE